MKYKLNIILTKFYKIYFHLKFVLKQLIFFTLFGKFWLMYFFLVPIVVPILFFNSVLQLDTNIPFLVYFFSGLLAFSFSFSAFKFSIRTLFIFRKIYSRTIDLPLKVFDYYFNLNFIYVFFNLIFLIICIIYFNINLDNINIIVFVCSIFNALYFGKLLTLLGAFINIIFKDSRIILRNLSTLFFVFSPIAYSIEHIKNEFILLFFTINPISQSALGIRKSLFEIEPKIIDLNILYATVFIVSYYILRNYIQKRIYKAYSITT